MALIPALPKTWANGEILTHSDLNNSFTTIRDAVNADALFVDVSGQTVSVTVTFSASQTFSAGISVTGVITLADAASRIVPGATSLALRNTANSADNILITDAGAVTIRAGLTVTTGTITGTLATAAQANVTSLGTLTALTIGGNLTFSGASRTIIPGTTDLVIRNVGSTLNALKVESARVLIGGAAGAGIDLRIGTVLATNATAGHVYLATCAGLATGVPGDGLGALIYDSTNKKLGVYDSGWIWSAALT